MKTECKTIQLDISDAIATVTLNRPEVGNAVNREFAEDLLKVVHLCETMTAVRVVLLTGAGKYFCVGGDLNYLLESGQQIAFELRQITAALHAAIARLVRMSAPLIVALNGPAGGGGMGLALVGDIVVASEQAKLRFAYPRLGYSADAATSYLLPRLVGLRRAQEIMFRDREISAVEAHALGLVTYVAAPSEYMTMAKSIAVEIAEGPSQAYGSLKRLLTETFRNSLDTHMEMEATHLVAAATSHDGKEGLDAFVHKRTPNFVGN